MTLRAHIETTYGFRRGMAFVWLSNGDNGYRLSMPVDLAEALCEFAASAPSQEPAPLGEAVYEI